MRDATTMLREVITTVLDAAGLVAVAGGTAAGLHPVIGWWGLAAGGVVLIAGSQLADWAASR